MSNLSCILYLSAENKPFDSKSLDLLVKKAREQNLKYDITGFLYYKQKQFFQYFEGTSENVQKLLQRLQKDPRHTFLECISADQLHQRRFTDWNMGVLRTNQLIQLKLEDVIIDYLSWIQSYNSIGDAKHLQNTWTLIDKLAHFKNIGVLSGK